MEIGQIPASQQNATTVADLRAAIVDTSKVAAMGGGADVSDTASDRSGQTGADPRGNAYGFHNRNASSAAANDTASSTADARVTEGAAPKGNAFGLDARIGDTESDRPAEASVKSVVEASLSSTPAPAADAEDTARARAVNAAEQQKMEKLTAALQDTNVEVGAALGDADSIGPAAEDVGKLPV